MPYYPMEQDWTLTTRLERIPMDLRYPGKYIVNSLPAPTKRKQSQNPWGPWSKPAKPKRGAAGQNDTNPNLIPLSKGKKASLQQTLTETEKDNQINQGAEIDYLDEANLYSIPKW